MKSISNYIFNSSPKKLAFLLVIFPLILVVLHTALSVIYRNLDTPNTVFNNSISLLTVIVSLCFLIPVLIWTLWIKGATFSVDKTDLDIPLKWFHIAFIIFIVYIAFVTCFTFIDFFPDGTKSIFSALSESISFVGLLIAYPLICHYASRAIYIKKYNKAASFSKTIGYTLLLLFLPISIPFFHNYFSAVTSEKPQLLRVYLIALGICGLLFVSTFVLAISGLI